jgi:hypothetical protein
MMRLLGWTLSILTLAILLLCVLPGQWEVAAGPEDFEIKAIKYGEYTTLFEDIWDVDSATDFYVIFNFEPDPSTINFTIFSEWEREEHNQDGYLPGEQTYYPNNRTLHFKPSHRMFYQRLQNIPEYIITITKDLRTKSGEMVLEKDFNLTIKIQELNSDGDDVVDVRDPFPFDPTQWVDSDGDGYGDNQTGNNPDRFTSDITQWMDRDGDGYGDNASGNNADLYPDDPDEWFDTDLDGIGNNEDEDDDQDGYPDEVEVELHTDPLNPGSTPPDTDGDHIPDAKDSDIDGDGYSNKEEKDAGTDPYDPDDHPSPILMILIIVAIVIVLLMVAIPIGWIIYQKHDSDLVEEDDKTKLRGGRTRRSPPPRRGRV